MKVESESEVAQSCPTLSDPVDRSLPGSSVHGIFQARVAASRGSSLVAVCMLLTEVASLVEEHGLWGARASVVVAHGFSSRGSRALEHRLNSCGAWAWLLQGM